MSSTSISQYRRRRSGLTVIEVIVAMLVFTIGGLGLAAGSAATVRQMSRTNLRMHSASIARMRDEAFHGSPCGTFFDGEETRSGVRSVWSVAPGNATTLDQHLERATMNDTHADHYLSAIACE